jgi:uncharacterized coiled-coil protein SlyX
MADTNTLPPPDGTLYVKSCGMLHPRGDGYSAATVQQLVQQRDEARRTVAEYERNVDELTAMMERLDDIQQSTLAAQEQHLAQINGALPALQRVVSERDQLIALIGRALEPWKGSPRNVMPTSVTVLIDGLKALAAEDDKALAAIDPAQEAPR